MAHPYTPGPKEFVFRAEQGDTQRVSVADPQEASVEFSAFFKGHDAGTYTIDDELAGQKLILDTDAGMITRVDYGEIPRAEYLHVGKANRFRPSAMLFFENGYAGLDSFGPWLAGPDATPESRAATITTEAGAIEEVARIWADSGIVDPTDQYYVFFDSHEIDDDQIDRAVLLTLLDRLALERVDSPDGAATGEIWVRTDARLDAEIALW